MHTQPGRSFGMRGTASHDRMGCIRTAGIQEPEDAHSDGERIQPDGPLVPRDDVFASKRPVQFNAVPDAGGADMGGGEVPGIYPVLSEQAVVFYEGGVDLSVVLRMPWIARAPAMCWLSG